MEEVAGFGWISTESWEGPSGQRATESAERKDGVATYCIVYAPDSMLIWGSELLFRRRIIILAWDLGSAS